jgi:hypothetical protein
VAIDPLELEAALDQDAAMHGAHPMQEMVGVTAA